MNNPFPGNKEYVARLSKHLFESMIDFHKSSGSDASVLDMFVAMNVFYCSSITEVERGETISSSEADERRGALLHMLSTAMSSIGYAHLVAPIPPERPPTQAHPIIGRLVTIIGTEYNGLLWSNGLVCEVIDVIAPPEDDVIYLVRLTNGSLGELMDGDFELVEIGESHE